MAKSLIARSWKRHALASSESTRFFSEGSYCSERSPGRYKCPELGIGDFDVFEIMYKEYFEQGLMGSYTCGFDGQNHPDMPCFRTGEGCPVVKAIIAEYDGNITDALKERIERRKRLGG